MDLGFNPTQNGQVAFSAIVIGKGCLLSSNCLVKINNNATDNCIQLNANPPAVGTVSLSQSVYPISLVVDQVL